jgi:hypothetical protein
MTSSTSLTSLLFGTGDARTTLRQRLGPLLVDLPVGSLAADLSTEIATAVTDLLDMPLGQLALDAWEKHQRVRWACEQTRRQPRRREVVRLAAHKVTVTQHPTVELTLAGTTQRLLTLDLVVEVTVTVATLIVEYGRIAEVRPGSATAEATLSAGDVRLAHGALERIELPAIRRPPVIRQRQFRRAS